MTSIIIVSIISSVIYVLIKKYAPEYALLAEISSIVLIILFVYPYICDVIDFYSSFETDNDYMSLVLKITGIAVLTQFSADICRDSGESALSSKVEFAGKTIILAMSLPVVEAVLELAIGLINEK